MVYAESGNISENTFARHLNANNLLFLCVIGAAGSLTECNPCPDGTSGGTITSINYPNDYTSTSDNECDYEFTVTTGHKLKFTVASGLNMPAGVYPATWDELYVSN